MTIPNKIKWLTIAHQMILLLLVEKETHRVRLKPVKPKTLHVLQITQRMSWKRPLRSEIILLYRYEDKYLIFLNESLLLILDPHFLSSQIPFWNLVTCQVISHSAPVSASSPHWAASGRWQWYLPRRKKTWDRGPKTQTGNTLEKT